MTKAEIESLTTIPECNEDWEEEWEKEVEEGNRIASEKNKEKEGLPISEWDPSGFDYDQQ